MFTERETFQDLNQGIRETLVEARSDSDVQIDRQIWV